MFQQRLTTVFDEMRKLQSPSRKTASIYEKIMAILHNIKYYFEAHTVMKRFVFSNFVAMERLRGMIENGDHRFTPEQNKELKKLTLFEDLGYKQMMNNTKEDVRKDFKQFIQGIFFFKNQHHYVKNGRNRGQDVKPLYHRDDSCGPKGLPKVAMDRHLDCHGARDNEHEKAKRTKHIVTCYIERLVFNELFQRMFHVKTDIEHLVHMRHTLDDYLMSCIDEAIKVKLTYSKITKLPKKLDVRFIDTKKFGKNKVRKREVYEKISNTEVHCRMYVYDERGRVVQRFSKNQTYDNEKEWIEQM